MKAFVRDGRCFFCARSDPGIFVPFLWDLGGEPYGREQNQGDHCRDWRRYHEIADCPERGQYGDQEYAEPAEGCGEASEAGSGEYGADRAEAQVAGTGGF